MRWSVTAAVASLALAARAQVAHAQAEGGAASGGRSEVFAGGEIENYLRYLQTLGVVGAHPWSVRAFAPRELDAILPDTAAHPWSAHYDLRRRATRGLVLDYVRPAVTARFNSAFPYGSNDAAVWAGRGLTTSAQFGVAARWGPLSARLAPMVSRAENAAFTLEGNGRSGPVGYGDLRYPRLVDRPRRFGSSPYVFVDPGQSELRLDALGVGVGVSTANQVWGPGDRYPMILSNNAAGFPHAFIGTSGPANLWLVKLQARLMWGELAQSDYSPAQGSDAFVSVFDPGRRRFASGLVAVLQPRGVPGLEIGGARFFHTPWRDGGPEARDYRKPFEVLFKSEVPRNPDNVEDPTTDYDNQLASVFMRWVLPRSGFELFGEYSKEDHNYDARDLVLEPDQNAGYLVGARKTFRRADGRVLGTRLEIVNLEAGPLGQRREQGFNYLGAYLVQGHTVRGQLMGADVGVGSAAGATLAADLYTAGGRYSVAWSRTLRGDNLPLFGPFGVSGPAVAELPRALDVMHALGAEALLFRGPADITAGLTGVLNLNREFRRDAFNVNASLGVRYNFGRSSRGRR